MNKICKWKTRRIGLIMVLLLFFAVALSGARSLAEPLRDEEVTENDEDSLWDEEATESDAEINPELDMEEEETEEEASEDDRNGFTDNDRERDYVITRYDIQMVVNENNTFDITETITADFRVPKHGIYRTLPLKNKLIRRDGTSSENHAKVKILSVSETYETERENGNLLIRIGSAGETVTGERTYVIKYNYNIGRDPLDNCDELYFNLIGKEWQAPLGGITFSIEMPKDFDSSKMGFSYGNPGTVNTVDVEFSVEGRKAFGKLNRVLRPGQALTVRCELPEGYFVGAGFENRTMDIICFSLPVIFLILAIIIWFKYGKDDMVVETVEFYPPDGINSLEAGYIYKGDADSVDVVSLLIYLADKGYISIAETEERGLLKKKKGFRITRVRRYDGHDANERTFLNGLFNCGSVVDGVESVTNGDLYNEFYVTKNKILSNMRKKDHQNKIFEKRSGLWTFLLFIMAVASFVLCCIPPVITYDEPEALLVLIFPLFGFGIMFASILGGKGKGDKRKKGKGCSGVFFGVIFGGAFGLIPTAAFIFPLLKEDTIHLIGFLVGCVCAVGIAVCYAYLPKRTPYGTQMLGRLRGFKNFLEVAEKEQLEQLVQEDPQYFYHILPYTYVLGVSDKWIKKFESILMQAPSWYETSYYDPYMFSSFMDNTMSTATRSMTSSPSESSGGGSSGGFSGGGFSGGGSGGGGGGAW